MGGDYFSSFFIDKKSFFSNFFSRKGLVLFLLILINFSLIYAITGMAIEQNSPSNVSVVPFRVLRDTFNGSTTNFTGLNESTLRNMSLVVLEKISYGKIEFEKNLDLVTMGGSNLTVNFDRDINLSDNLIYVDVGNLPGVDKQVLLSFYGITYTSPEIYHNAVLCTDCTLVSYSSGIYKSRVSSFNGLYYLREGAVSSVCGNGVCESGEDSSNCPSDCASSGGGGGGGGGGGTTPPSNNTNVSTTGTSKYDFFISPIFFELKMNKGTYYRKLINVTNNGTNSLAISVIIEGLEKFIFPESRSFTLGPGESKNLRLDIYVSSSGLADVYVGKIHFRTSQVRKEAEVILQVKESDALFDIRTEVLKKYIPPGGRVRANVSIINMGDLRNFDVSLEYKVIDFDKKEYTIKKEDFAMGKTYSNVFFLDLPSNMSMGNYLFYTRVSYKNINASSYDTFVIEKISTFSWILLMIIIILAAYLIYKHYVDRKKRIKFNFKKSPVGAQKTESLPVKKGKPIEVPELPDELE